MFMHLCRERAWAWHRCPLPQRGCRETAGTNLEGNTPNLPTNIVDFGRFDSTAILNLRGEIPRPIGDFPETLCQAMLVGIMLVGRLGVRGSQGIGGCKQQLVRSCFTPNPLHGPSCGPICKITITIIIITIYVYYVYYYYYYLFMQTPLLGDPLSFP